MEKLIISNQQVEELKSLIRGEVLTDQLSIIAYSTDASVYSEEPAAVVIPTDVEDIKKIVGFASKYKIPLIPRAGGTSLAGQVVGSGVVVDVSKNLTQIIELNTDEKWVRVQTGVIPDELNRYLKPHGLFFGPETSTANRCTLGGMVGNNACGLHAVVYGTTRDHLLEVKGVLSDGSDIHLKPLTNDEYYQKQNGHDIESKIYQYIHHILSDREKQKIIRANYPHPGLVRRNHGYALDVLLDSGPFSGNGKPFNLSKLIAGSEGTLVFITELKLNLVEIPPSNKALVCAHF
jgi:FAD/FMN-containing dehydrogenase